MTSYSLIVNSSGSRRNDTNWSIVGEMGVGEMRLTRIIACYSRKKNRIIAKILSIIGTSLLICELQDPAAVHPIAVTAEECSWNIEWTTFKNWGLIFTLFHSGHPELLIMHTRPVGSKFEIVRQYYNPMRAHNFLGHAHLPSPSPAARYIPQL